MKKALLLLGLLCTLFTNAQEDESNKYKFTIGLNTGFGKNINSYKFTDESRFSFYEIPEQYSLGVDAGVFLTNNLRFRLDLRYVKMMYGVDWTNDLYSIEDTKVNLYSLCPKT